MNVQGLGLAVGSTDPSLKYCSRFAPAFPVTRVTTDQCSGPRLIRAQLSAVKRACAYTLRNGERLCVSQLVSVLMWRSAVVDVERRLFLVFLPPEFTQRPSSFARRIKRYDWL